ncbi:peptidylprolyl isomerase [Neoaquamicrobium sediminum]|uniref:peptidylprolyl isomerase n=1 Tax=Neoaquamicrobium sediminum TaxID=1849104 RepID=UPI001564730C|nr:peptidylprolyl isomerase [Mesorhizobium sediminum]NRC55118.1 peptidylprolyl isomerase [Mesorhizobium sediminum]
MLNSLRNAARSWIAKLLLVMLVLSFAVWGISGQIFGGLGSNVLTAGDTRVSILEYRLAYDRQLSLLSQQFGVPVTREQAQQFGVDNRVLSQLAAGAVLDEQARKMRLGLSRDRLAAMTAEDPAFQGADGRFDRNQFDFVLRQIGMRPEDYLKNREQAAVRQQIIEAVSDGMTAPDAFLRAVSLYQGEDRTVDYIVLSRSLVEPIEEPARDVLEAYFEENKANYAAPEYRRISYVKLEPADIADPAAIQAEEVERYYEDNATRFTSPEQRKIEQLVFADAEAAQAALDKIRGGATFEEVVTEQGKTMGDVVLGIFAKADVADPAIAEAAFALAEGEVSDVVDGAFGSLLVRVPEVQPAKVQPLAEVEQQIRSDIALGEATRILDDVYEGYEDARAGGETMAEAAARNRLEVVTVEAVDRSGRNPEGTILTDLPESNALLQEAFDSEVGVENSPLNTGSSGYLFYEVDDVTEARDRSLDEVRDQVVTDWKENEVATRLATRAEEIEKQVADGKALTEVAEELELEVQVRRGLKRDANDAELGDAGVAAVFSVARGETGLAPAQDGDAQVVFRVTDVLVPAGAGPDALPAEARDRFASAISDDLLDQLVARLQTEYPVTIDRGAVQQALSF